MAPITQQKQQDITSTGPALSRAETFEVSMPRMSRVAIDAITVEDVPATELNKINGTKYTIKLTRDAARQDPLVEELPFFASKIQPALGKDQRATYLRPPTYDPAKREVSYVLYPLRFLSGGEDLMEKPRDVPSFSQMKFLQVASEDEVARVKITPHSRLANSGVLSEARLENISKALEEYIGKTYDLENPPAMESSFKKEGQDYILSIKFKKKEE